MSSARPSFASRTVHRLRSFVYCRQRTDERLRRGGEQKSVVVLAAAPHASVLRPLSQHAGALYFNRGPAALAEVRMHAAHDACPQQPNRTPAHCASPVGPLRMHVAHACMP